MSSSGLVGVVRPGGCLVVGCAGLEASVQDAEEPVGELAQRGVVVWRRGCVGGRGRPGRRQMPAAPGTLVPPAHR